ncbi:flagellar biosynthesis protein FlhB [Methylothermus subterraneus]
MAEESDQERTEEPTPKRLEDARRQGQIPRSRELNTFVVVTVGLAGCGALAPSLGEGLAQIMAANFRLRREEVFDSQALLEHSAQALFASLSLLAPWLLVLLLAALAAPLMLGGWVFSAESLKPTFGRIDPLQGLRRMFALHSAVELIKSLLKVALIALLAWSVLQASWADLERLVRADLKPALAKGVALLWQASLWLCASLAVLAGIDAPYQLWAHRRKLRMSLQEVKEEMKESEGRPEVKAKIRQLQRERALRRMMEEVPKADVVVTNPTHFAVALKYDPSRGGAPKVVAKGVELIAAQIRSRAIAAGVPLVAAPPLARALYYSTELGQEIPQGLYLAVAQVLAYVYQLKAAPGKNLRPPENLVVPEEYLRR